MDSHVASNEHATYPWHHLAICIPCRIRGGRPRTIALMAMRDLATNGLFSGEKMHRSVNGRRYLRSMSAWRAAVAGSPAIAFSPSRFQRSSKDPNSILSHLRLRYAQARSLSAG